MFDKIKGISVEIAILYILSNKDSFIDNVEVFQIDEDIFNNLLKETGKTDKAFVKNSKLLW